MKTTVKASLALLAFIAIAVTVILSFGRSEHDGAEAPAYPSILSGEAESIAINSEYKLCYSSSDSIQADQLLASKISSLANSISGTSLRAVPDMSADADEKEILIGFTNRAESAELYRRLSEVLVSPDDLAWGYACINGKLLYGAVNVEAFEYGSEEFLSILSESNFTVSSDLLVIRVKPRAEYDAELEAKRERQRAERLLKFKEMNAEFTLDDFGGEAQEMPSGMYKLPETYPTEGMHPRLFVNGSDVSDLYDDLMNEKELTALRNALLKYADEWDFTGEFPTAIGKSGNIYRYDTAVLAQIEAKAFMYLLTKDELYGYEAIVGVKNAALSLLFTEDIHGDTYHGASQLMIHVAKVYDWCYDLLTDDDKNQLIACVSNVLSPQLEPAMQLPPSGLSPVAGHGTGPQFIRDWMTVSIAFFDEMPSWWNFVGGRYYEEYVPVINSAFQNGWASQGTTTYGDSKYFTKAWAAWLLKKAVGESPYTADFEKGAYFFFSHIQPNGKYFQTGDGTRFPDGCSVGDGYCFMFVAAALSGDPTVAAMAKLYSNNYTYFSYSFTQEMTVPDTLIFYTLGPDVSEEAKEELELIQYFGSPAGTMTARNSWSEDGIAVLMRIGTMTMADHDNCDHGTFQIYYKGLLAGTSGSYKEYGADIHKYYLRATIAHNGLLVFDPSLADDTPEYNSSGTAILNADRYYYSGSQRVRSTPDTIETWLGGDYVMGEMLGAEWGYNADGSASFGFISGDITAAYPSETVSYVGRSMLTVFTGDADVPMIFITHDQITSLGANFTKYFLLHTVNEPELDEASMTATVTADEGGRLVLRSLLGADRIEKIGGEGKAYWINGKNCMDEYNTTDYYDQIWGRIEISAVGNFSDTLINAMYVTDADSSASRDFVTAEADGADIVQSEDIVAVFSKTPTEKKYKEFTFSANGTGLNRYFVSGLETGTWKISADGVPVATVYASEEGGFVNFIAPSGIIRVIPCADVIGDNGGRIKYSLGGGTFTGEYPLSYTSDTAVTLPTNVEKPDAIFVGWYTTPDFEAGTEIGEIPVGMTGTFSVYARWLENILNVDYETRNVDVRDGNKLLKQGITYNLNSSAGSYCITKLDESDVKYLEWAEGDGAPIITTSSTEKNYALMKTEDECASFTVTLSRNADERFPATTFRIYTKKTVSGEEKTTRQSIFTTNEQGEVRLGNSSQGPVAAVVTSEPVTLRIVLDFKNEELCAYDENGTVTASVSVKANADSGASSMSEWRKLVDSIIFYWVGDTDGTGASMRIYGIRIDEGDRFKDLEPVDGAIIYSLGNGGTLPFDAPLRYSDTAPTELPIPTPSGDKIFSGWYTTPTFQKGTGIRSIPRDTEGVAYVYAKWTLPMIGESYSGTDIDVTAGDASANDVNYRTNGGADASFITKTDGSGTAYLEWREGTGESEPFVFVNNGAIADLDADSLSYELVFSKNGEDPLPLFYMYTMAQRDVSGNKLASSNRLPLFKVTADGIYLSKNTNATAADADIKIGDITDGKMTVRIVLDFAECKIKAYTDSGEVLERSFSVPESSGATTGTEFRKTFTSYLFYMMTSSPAETDASMRIYGIRVTEGDAFDMTDASILDGKISYVTGGGALPEDAPTEYTESEALTLPVPTKERARFDGWYTTSSFRRGSEISEIPAGTKGLVTLYAKWTTTVLCEDYSDTVLNVTSGDANVKLVNYRTNDIAGTSFITKTDENGDPYLEWCEGAGSSDPFIFMNDGSIAELSGTSVSYELVFSKNGDAPLPIFYLRTLSQYDVSGNKLASSNSLPLFKVTEGAIYLSRNTKSTVDGNDIKIGDVTDGKMTVRIVLDFAECKVKAYTDTGEVLERSFSVPASSGATTGKEYQRTFTSYVFYMMTSSPAETEASMRVHSLRVIEGNIFE